MNNKNKYSLEELKFSLPDFIKNQIEDIELKETIESELITNSELKIEFEEFQNTMNFLQNSEFSNPPESYFNNLSVKINEKIALNENELNWWEKLSLIWKVLIPAIPVAVLLIFLLSNYSGNESLKTEVVKENSTEISKPNETSETGKEMTKSDDKTEISKESKEKSNFSNNKVELNKNPIKSKKYDKINKSFNIDDILYKSETIFETSETDENLTDTGNEDEGFYKNDNFAGNIDMDNETDSDEETVAEDENYDLLYQNDIIEDKSLEDELQRLTPEEQNEIFTNLINSKL